MALTLQGIVTDASCDTCDCGGGIVRIAIFDFCYFTSGVVDANRCVTSIALNTTGVAAEYTPETEDDTAFFRETAELRGAKCKQVVYEGFGKFECVDKDVNEEANRILSCRSAVAAIEWTNGIVKLYGLDAVSDNAGGYTLKRSVKALNILPVVDSGTGADADRVEFNFSGTSRKFAPIFDGTIDDILAL
jgi:hypothetical protein